MGSDKVEPFKDGKPSENEGDANDKNKNIDLKDVSLILFLSIFRVIN